MNQIGIFFCPDAMQVFHLHGPEKNFLCIKPLTTIYQLGQLKTKVVRKEVIINQKDKH